MAPFNWDVFVKVATALAPYAWPATAVILALTFRPQLKALLGRLNEVGGAKFSPAGEQLAAFSLIRVAEKEPATAAPDAIEAPTTTTTDSETKVEHLERVNSALSLALSASSEASDAVALETTIPEIVIVAMAIDFEKELRRYALLTHVSEEKTRSISELINALQHRLPPDFVASARIFTRLRNDVLHGQKVEAENLGTARRVAAQLIAVLRERNADLSAATFSV